MADMIESSDMFKLPENIKTDAPSAFEFYWQVPEELPYFEGHFPEMPILPAVAIVDASFAFLGQKLQKEISLESIRSGKFLGPIVPCTNLKIKYTQRDETGWLIHWLLQPENTLLADLRLTIR
jgi:3-hydroxymyristoyl/3-hydroxydecanoyl-(acyl carrier protein) dehydratase